MSHHAFHLLSPAAQLYWVLKHATYLAQRWGETGAVNLYHCDDGGRGFFTEVGHNDGRGFAVLLRSFIETSPLEAYGHAVPLPQA